MEGPGQGRRPAPGPTGPASGALTTDAPAKGSAGDAALRVVLGPGKPICDVVELLSAEGQERLHRYATDGIPS